MGFVPLVKPQSSFLPADADPPLEMSHLIIVHHLGMCALHPGFILQGSLSHLLECSITFHTELEGVTVSNSLVGDCVNFLLLL